MNLQYILSYQTNSALQRANQLFNLFIFYRSMDCAYHSKDQEFTTDFKNNKMTYSEFGHLVKKCGLGAESAKALEAAYSYRLFKVQKFFHLLSFL